ncbi:replication-associated recombination protein A, partial [Anoxybacillus sp.]|uniref:replication-associated recombination protein A n=1 Tax=Anoxybacillus sp. TaxID=1872573 RepID=UPI002602734B
IDEIHRFTKAQQDYLLPHVENGLVTLIGATTENPFHSINPAVRSRLGQIKQLHPLTKEQTIELLRRALHDPKRGLGNWHIDISDEALVMIAEGANGDARAALTMLEEAVYATKQEDQRAIVDIQTVSFCVENKALMYDKQGDTYYSLLSAFQKSVRGSDVDAALHYLARLLEGGDVTAVCRRLAVIAYEDIGLANPFIGVKVMSAIQAAERLGMPEARIPLATVTIDMCLSPKSNSAYKAIDAAIHDVRNGKGQSIPLHLQDAHYDGAKRLGRGIGYKYPHDYPYSWVEQQYLPDDLIGMQYYKPKQSGEEKQLAHVYERLNERKKQ